MCKEVITETTDIWEALRKESSLNLVKRIVEDNDRAALDVLLEERRLVRIKDGSLLLLPEFLIVLRNRLAPPERYDKDSAELADCAYDLTLQKYTNMPCRCVSKQKTGLDINSKADSRNYYRPLLNIMNKLMGEGKIRNQIDEEFYVGRVLQNLVYKNFLRSKLECKRKTPFSIRYVWNVKGKRFYLWYPSYMTAKKFRSWLEKNVKDINFDNPSEQQCIQSLINNYFSWCHHVPLYETGIYYPAKGEIYSAESNAGEGLLNNLAETVADKKVRHIKRLRRSIQKLGEGALRELILKVFEDLTNDEYELIKTANQFGISKSTLSRFAGSRWFEISEDNKNLKIPDLWKNTAKVLAENPDYMETVIRCGFGQELEKILSVIKGEGDQNND